MPVPAADDAPQEEVRLPGLRGAKESHEPALDATQFFEPREGAPLDWDGTHGLTSLGMDWNDTKSCCGAAAVDHGNVLKADNTALIGTLGYPTYPNMISSYYAYGRAMGEEGEEPDEGVQNSTWLGFLYKMGIIDGYWEVPVAQMRDFAVPGNGLLLACLLGDDADADFTNKLPWGGPGYVADPDDGHDTWLAKYTPDDFTVVTWGGLQVCTNQFQITDAWGIVDKNDPQVNWPALNSVLQELHGTGGER